MKDDAAEDSRFNGFVPPLDNCWSEDRLSNSLYELSNSSECLNWKGAWCCCWSIDDWRKVCAQSDWISSKLLCFWAHSSGEMDDGVDWALKDDDPGLLFIDMSIVGC